jgi:2-amino-4-hydroxy-6-hydroxymethyldihydropteridine diphosphokinase
MPRVYVSIGSNLEDPMLQVRRAVDRLRAFGEVVAVSSIYRTAPWGKPDQPDFVNAVVLLETLMLPHELLMAFKKAERELGRGASERWGPRIIDFDILTYDDEKIEAADLVIPHPHMLERAFVLVPLAEIDPSYAAARDALGTEALEEVRLLQ